MTALEHYRQLEQQLRQIRQEQDESTEEEDRILDEMDIAWKQLSELEQATLRAEMPPAPHSRN
jgi:hypothetical protein